MQWIANPQNREFESHPVLQFFKKSMLGSSIGQDTRFSSWEEGFNSPTELQNLVDCKRYYSRPLYDNSRGR